MSDQTATSTWTPSVLDRVRYEGSLLPFRGLRGTIVGIRTTRSGKRRYLLELPSQEGLRMRQVLQDVSGSSLVLLGSEA